MPENIQFQVQSFQAKHHHRAEGVIETLLVLTMHGGKTMEFRLGAKEARQLGYDLQVQAQTAIASMNAVGSRRD